MMAGGALQHNGITVTVLSAQEQQQHVLDSPAPPPPPPSHMESEPLDSRKRPLETPTEAGSTKRTNIE
ncbi:RNA-binding protein Nova-1 isoform X1, partial [Tachysurus ichikawai]